MSERAVFSQLTVTVVVRRDWRCWLGLRLMRLGERVLAAGGAGVHLRVLAHDRHD